MRARTRDMKLTFTDAALDHAGLLRSDPDWIESQLADRKAQAVLFAGGDLAMDEQGAPLIMRAKYAARLPLKSPGLIFLGLLDGAPWFAGAVEKGVAEKGPDFRQSAIHAPPELASTFGRARSLLMWHREHAFCSNCGEKTVGADAGSKRICPSCQTEHFPRVNPSVIMLVHAGDKCVLGRQPNWPEGMYSTLAGFMEPGETVDAACAREVAEEVHLKVTSVEYVTTQPWPFPSQLMIGLMAEVEPGEVVPDDDLEDARWFMREEVRTLFNSEIARMMPSHFSIARMLIERWLAAGSD
ncbi:MAG: NAD(+) diphosphatase [Oceanicaulis sp.]|nr:NAD(+) diphosphatase [Oceanicaulis sp.]MBC40147.1 NAD(+) diphosphatase [Oceanicaulis sp.]MBG36968.1 NAD(+) diphosphatase [Oceanicaulis sp.]HBU61224.1 NAD(+) diphosphatase [Oceanicaulis sp.]HCR94651.1 NAD(+) diphosphatase [Oceanicaulis sp.]